MTTVIPRLPGLYRWRNRENGRLYIGSTASLYRREVQHRSALTLGKHTNPHLQAAWLKYGAAAFVFEIIELVAQTDDLATMLIERERATLNSVDASLLYNCGTVMPTRLGSKWSDESRKKRSDAMRGKRPSELFIRRGEEARRGRVVSPETREKIASKQRGRTLSPERKAALSAARRAWSITPEWRIANSKAAAKRRGKKRPPEVGAKISAAKKGHAVSAETRAKISASKRGRKYRPSSDQGAIQW